MKKILFAMLMLLTTGMSGFAQTLTVANGTETNAYVPIYGYYADDYLISQTIYPASMLATMNGEDIISMLFYLSSSPASNWGVNFEVRLKEVPDSIFSSESFITTAATDVVYTGPMEPVSDQIEINLDVPYSYNGGNLLLEVRSLNTGSYSQAYFYGITATSASVQGYDYSDVNDIEPDYQDFIPKTTFGYGVAPTCGKVSNLSVTNVTGATANLSWSPNVLGTASSYNIYVLDNSTGNVNMETTTATSYVLTGLSESTSYTVGVFVSCTDGTDGDTVFKHFTTTCLSPVNITVGDGDGTTSYVPSNSCYNYSYTQQIIPASAIGSDQMDFTALSFQCSSVSAANRTWDIYAALVPATADLSSGWILPSTVPFQLVYSGPVSVTTGWFEVTLDTALVFDGTSNLLISILDHTGSFSCSNYFYYHNDNSTTNMARYAYRDDSTYDPAGPDASGSLSSDVANIRLGFCDNSTCIRPVNLTASNIDETAVDLSWVAIGSESSWEVEYRAADDTAWNNAGTTNTNPFTLNGLNNNTSYTVHVRALCGGDDVSLWSEAMTFRTACGAITELPYFNDFEDVIMDNGTAFITCWSRYTTNPDRVVRCYGSATHSGDYALDFNYSPSCTTAAVTPMLDASIPLNTVMLDFWAFSGLGEGWMEVGTMSDPTDFTTYEFYDTVRLNASMTWENVLISFANYTGSNQYIAFLEINGTQTSYIFDDFSIKEIPNCMHPTNLAVDAITNTSVTLSWTEVGDATAWTVEYGLQGFTPGEGTTVSAYTNPFMVENLTTLTTYDFYVYADCGSDLSDPFGPVSATPGQYIFGTTGSDTLTTCGVILYDDGGPDGNYGANCNFTLVLYPEAPDAMMSLTGLSSTESNYDYLKIYDGVGTGNQVLNLSGSNQTVNVISTTGPLTIQFTSDGSVYYAGFQLLAQCITCFPPTNVTTSNPTLDGATITWSGNGDSYVLFLNGDMTTGYDATATTYTFTGLNASSSYTVQVAAICDGDTSMLSSSATFATGCAAITITADDPWTESFENYPGSGVQQFICWDRPVTEVVDNGTAPFVYCNYGEAAHSGTNTAEMKGHLNMLALPEFTNNLSDLRVSFWATGYSYSNTNVEIGYMTDVTDSSTFVPVIANAGVPGPRGGSGGGHGNYMGPFSFSGVTATNARIALRYTGPGSSSGWNVDDFVVEIAPDCESPLKSSVTATNIGGHVATITWVDPNPNHTAWTVYYKETSETDWSTAPATDTTVVLTGLDPLTQYDVYVITNCGTSEANPDATHTIHFTTTVACPAPTGLTLATVSTDEATITWNGTASSYNVEYGETGFTPGTGTTDVASTESITLTNLDPSTSYTIYVNSDCNDNNDSLSTTVSFTFTTTQVPAPLPYTADFTQTNEWILNNGTCANYWTRGTVNTVPSLFVTNNGTTPGYYIGSNSVVSAEKLLAVGDNASVLISFDAYVGGEGTSSTSWDYLKVFFAPAETDYPPTSSISTPDYATYGYSTNAVDFQSYLSQTGSSYNPYKLSLTNDTLHVEVEMPNPYDNPTSSSAAKLVFLWCNDGSSGDQPGAIISNVNVSVNNCPKPTNLTADNITTTSADISWTASDEVSAWILEYQAAGESTWTVVSVSSTPAYTLSNLSSATTYMVRVKSDCGNEESSYETLSFSTSCGVVTVLPYTENFDNISSGNESAFPNCWSRPIQYSGYPYAVTAYSHTSPASLRFQSLTSSPTTAVTPQFAEAIQNLSLNFWLKAESTTYSGTFEVGVMTDPNDVSTFVGVMTIDPASTSWEEYTIHFDTTALSGTDKYIAFRQHSNSSSWYFWLDDVVVDLSDSTGPGPVITDPTVATNAATAIEQTTATLNATITNPDNVTITAKGFEWKATTGGTYTQIAGSGTGNSFTANLTSLTPSTNYTFRAFITFNGQTITGSEQTFTTLDQSVEPCDVPTGLTASEITGESIFISWDNNPDVSSWNIQYRPQGGQLSTASTNTNSYPLTGLTANTIYQIQVQANCGDGNLSDWSQAISVTTTGIENWLENSVTLYPNPAKEYVDIRVDGDLNVTMMEVYDIYGKLINAMNVVENPTRINVSGLADGMYFVRVSTEAGMVTKTFVKR
ncbi:MAG: fibronectin type III domain-containing protein [Prevotella sp.]|nr:fibronectin type III domain-containing protein [Prevotella sp.]